MPLIPAQFHEGAIFERDDGAMLRIDDVTPEEVYFVSWRPGQEIGSMIRMAHATFLEAWAEQWERKP